MTDGPRVRPGDVWLRRTDGAYVRIETVGERMVQVTHRASGRRAALRRESFGRTMRFVRRAPPDARHG